MSVSEDIIYRYWGKADKNASLDDDLSYHPAICHMLDTGLVAQALLNYSSHAFLNSFLQHLDCSDNEKIAWISFIVALHDIGKISPGFQAKRMDLINDLPKESYPFSSDFDETDHGRITFMILPAIFEQAANCSRITAIEISRAIGGHHGEFHQNQSPQHRKSPGKGKWEDARNLIVKNLAQEFKLNWDTFPFKNEESISASGGCQESCHLIHSLGRLF
ncbi:MAG: CRISPR-associated endonuclease Cas3'' [Thermodesulfobacteriota bacterium]|nr:CRISPR-associated endonuclease Cas3'' [Thermodesulfobacteriota bacterium]